MSFLNIAEKLLTGPASDHNRDRIEDQRIGPIHFLHPRPVFFIADQGAETTFQASPVSTMCPVQAHRWVDIRIGRDALLGQVGERHVEGDLIVVW